MLIIKNDCVIANIPCGPLTVLDILAFKIHGDTNIDDNFSGTIILEHFNS